MKLFLVNTIIRFLIEMFTLILIIIVGLTKYSVPINFLVGIVLPVVFILIWTLFMAPHSMNRVSLPYRILIEILIFGSCYYLICLNLASKWGTIYIIAVMANAILSHIGDAIYDLV